MQCNKKLNTETESQVRYIWVDKDTNELCWSKSKIIDSKKTKRLLIKEYISKVEINEEGLCITLYNHMQSNVFISNIMKKYPLYMMITMSNTNTNTSNEELLLELCRILNYILNNN